MKLFIAYVNELDRAFDWRIHCDREHDGMGFVLTEVEDQVATVGVVRRQTGYSILSAASPKNMLVSWSPTGDPADAVLIARARVTEMPSDLFGQRQTLNAVCAPADVEDRILAWLKANRTSSPETDFLFADADEEDASSYLIGRSEVVHVDAATHAIGTVGEVSGVRIVDMLDVAIVDSGRVSDGVGEFGPPVKTLRAKLPVAWTQEAHGSCDIGKRIRDVDTLDPSFGQSLQGMLSAGASQGWSAGDAGYSFQQDTDETFHVDTGTTYHSIALEGNAPDFRARYLERDHRLTATFKRFSIHSVRMPMRYDYAQDREEVVFAALDLPVQDTGIEYPDEEVVELGLKSLFEDPSIKDYEAGKFYVAGQLVRNNQNTYRCREDHYSLSFNQARPAATNLPIRGTRGPGVRVVLGYWELVRTTTDVDPGMYSFVDTDRGQRAIRHVMCRLRKEGLRRLRARRVTLTFRWQDAAHVTRDDSIVFPGRWTELEDRAMIGKVLAKTWSWPEKGAPTIQLEVGVCFGRASDGGPVLEPYGEDDYGAHDYGQAAAGDVRNSFYYEVEADPVRRPVVHELLSNAGYAMQSYRVGNRASTQLAAASLIGEAGGDIRQCSETFSTWVKIRMRPINSYGVLRREVDVVGVLYDAPQGVLL